MSRSGFRNDRVFWNCDRYDMPHRYDPPKCPPGYNSIDILKDKGRPVKPAQKPKVNPHLTIGWRCPKCDITNPIGKPCRKCGG